MNLTLALLMLQAAPETASAAEPEIVVLAQKLKSIRFVWKASDKSGAWKLTQCKIKKSSGDKAVDGISCKALEQCLQVLPVGAKQASAEFHSCVSERRNALIADLATARAAAADPKP